MIDHPGAPLVTRWKRMALRSICPRCGKDLVPCAPVDASVNYVDVPEGDAWARRCLTSDCGFKIIQFGPGCKMTLPSAEEEMADGR